MDIAYSLTTRPMPWSGLVTLLSEAGLGPNTNQPSQIQVQTATRTDTLLFHISIQIQLYLSKSNTNTLQFFYSNTIQVHWSYRPYVPSHLYTKILYIYPQNNAKQQLKYPVELKCSTECASISANNINRQVYVKTKVQK